MTFGTPTAQDGWQSKFKQALAAKNIQVYFVPGFSDATVNGVGASDMYKKFPVANGLFSWDSAWPYASDGKAKVSSSVDQQYLSAAKGPKKTYMMRSFHPLPPWRANLEIN